MSDPVNVSREQLPAKPDGLPFLGRVPTTQLRPRLRGVSMARPGPRSFRPVGEEDADAPGRSNERRYAERNPGAGQRLHDFRDVERGRR